MIFDDIRRSSVYCGVLLDHGGAVLLRAKNYFCRCADDDQMMNGRIFLGVEVITKCCISQNK